MKLLGTQNMMEPTYKFCSVAAWGFQDKIIHDWYPLDSLDAYLIWLQNILICKLMSLYILKGSKYILDVHFLVLNSLLFFRR